MKRFRRANRRRNIVERQGQPEIKTFRLIRRKNKTADLHFVLIDNGEEKRNRAVAFAADMGVRVDSHSSGLSFGWSPDCTPFPIACQAAIV